VNGPFGLVCALNQELACLEKACSAQPVELRRHPFKTVSLSWQSGEAVVVVSGMGKVAAAASAQYLVDVYRPTLLISFGLAGALGGGLKVGDLVLPARVMQGDVGTYDATGYRHPYLWDRGENGLRLSHCCAVHSGLHAAALSLVGKADRRVLASPLVTCDQSVFSRSRRRELRRDLDAEAVDMESAALARVASLNGLPFLVLRAISDDSDLEMEDGSFFFSLQSGRKRDRVGGIARCLLSASARKRLVSLHEGSARACAVLGEAAWDLLLGLPRVPFGSPSALAP